MFVIASIYTNTSRCTNLHTTFYYKPILCILYNTEKKSMYISKMYSTKEVFVKNKVVLMKCTVIKRSPYFFFTVNCNEQDRFEKNFNISFLKYCSIY